MLPDTRIGLATSPSIGSRLVKPPGTSTRKLYRPDAVGTAVLHSAPLVSEVASTRPNRNEIFVCDEETQFYSQCLEKLLVKNSSSKQTVIEFGSGDGTPVISCLAQSQFMGTIHGFELNPKSAALARSKAVETGLSQRYQIHNSCFFKGISEVPASCLIANPPYIPAPDNDILMPALHGGVDGANLTRDLLSLGFDSAILLLSAYANPVETIEHARQLGYQVTDFMITPMPFGYYSSEPKVKNWIWKMREEGKAYCSDNWYLLAGVLFQKRRQNLPVNGNGNGSANFKRKSDHLSNGSGQQKLATDGDHLQNNILAHTLGHRYSTTCYGAVNQAEDQTDELLKVMTALR